MPVIPNSWRLDTISSIATKITSGGTPNRSNKNYFGGDIPWVTTGELKDTFIYDTKEKVTEEGYKKSATKLLPVNTLLMAMYGATIGKIGIIKKKATCNQACCALICDEKQILFQFLFYKLISMREFLISLGAGAGQPNISQGIIRDLQIEIPPLIEQQKIAQILSSVDTAIENNESLIIKLTDLKKALMLELFTKGIGHKEFKNSPLGKIPKEWEVTECRNIISEMKSGLSRKLSAQDIGLPMMTSGNIQDGLLDYSELKYWYEKDPQGANTKDYLLQENDILLCFINSIAQIGKLCLFQNIGRPAIYTTNLLRLRFTDKASSKFAFYLFSTGRFQQEIKYITKPAVNQASFTKDDFYSIQIALPSKTEQDKIVSILSSVDDRLLAVNRKSLSLNNLKMALMQDLLSGKVRVNTL